MTRRTCKRRTTSHLADLRVGGSGGGRRPAELAGGAADVVAPRRTRLTGLFRLVPVTTGHCHRQENCRGKYKPPSESPTTAEHDEPVEVTSASKRASMSASALPRSG